MLGGNWLPIPKNYCKYTNKQKQAKIYPFQKNNANIQIKGFITMLGENWLFPKNTANIQINKS